MSDKTELLPNPLLELAEADPILPGKLVFWVSLAKNMIQDHAVAPESLQRLLDTTIRVYSGDTPTK